MAQKIIYVQGDSTGYSTGNQRLNATGTGRKSSIAGLISTTTNTNSVTHIVATDGSGKTADIDIHKTPPPSSMSTELTFSASEISWSSYQSYFSKTILFNISNMKNIKKIINGKINFETSATGHIYNRSYVRELTDTEITQLNETQQCAIVFQAGIGVSTSFFSNSILAKCENITWDSGTLESYGPVAYTPPATSYLFPGDGSSRPVNVTEHTSAVYRYTSTGGSASATTTYAIEGSISYRNIQLELTVEYEDAPIKITSTLDKDTCAADTSFALNITNQDGENTVTAAKCTAEFSHTRGESVTSIQTLTDFTPYSYAQLLPYDPNDNQNFVTRVQRLFEYIPDTWKTNTELLVFKPGDIYTIKLTVSEYTVDDVEYTDKPVEAIFEYTIGEGIDIQVSTPVMTSPTEANKNNIPETASLTFSLPGQVGTYAVEKIEWTATVTGPNFTTTPLQLTQTGSNIPTETPPLGTATFEIPLEERAKVTKNVEYILTITAVATTVDGKSTDEQITTITGCIFKPADYTLNFTIPALQNKKKIYSGEEITLNFGLVKTANNEPINGLTYHLTMNVGVNTETYSVTNANTYAWRNSALPGAITYNFICTTQYNSQDYTANITIGSTDYPTYAKLISAKNLSFSDGGLLYYNTDTVPVAYELVIPNSVTTEKFVITTSLDNTAFNFVLKEQTIENNAKIYTTSGTQNIPLAVEPYVNYRGKVDIKFTATAREDIDSAYIDEDFKELTLSFAIRSPECEYVYPAEEGLVSCIANPIFRLKSTKGTFSRGTGYVGTPNYPGVWIEVPLEFPDNNDLTECTFKWPFAVEDNTTYDVYFKEVLNSDVVLNDSMKNISPSKVTRWTADLINKTLVSAAGYRLLEKYSYRKLLANLLQWKGTKIDYSVADNESQLAILIDLFGTSGYTEIKNAINNYGIDSPQAWNAFMKALL